MRYLLLGRPKRRAWFWAEQMYGKGPPIWLQRSSTSKKSYQMKHILCLRHHPHCHPPGVSGVGGLEVLPQRPRGGGAMDVGQHGRIGAYGAQPCNVPFHPQHNCNTFNATTRNEVSSNLPQHRSNAIHLILCNEGINKRLYVRKR